MAFSKWGFRKLGSLLGVLLKGLQLIESAYDRDPSLGKLPYGGAGNETLDHRHRFWEGGGGGAGLYIRNVIEIASFLHYLLKNTNLLLRASIP